MGLPRHLMHLEGDDYESLKAEWDAKHKHAKNPPPPPVQPTDDSDDDDVPPEPDTEVTGSG